MADKKVWLLDLKNRIIEVTPPPGSNVDPEELASELAKAYPAIIYFMDEATTAEDLMSDFKSELQLLLTKHNMPGRCQMQAFVLSSLLSNILLELERASRQHRGLDRV